MDVEFDDDENVMVKNTEVISLLAITSPSGVRTTIRTYARFEYSNVHRILKPWTWVDQERRAAS